MAETIGLFVDERAVEVPPGTFVLEAVRRAGIQIPHLCWTEGLEPEGNCRSCLVEIEGERRLSPACARRVEPGMVVRTDTARARAVRNGVLRLLAAAYTPLTGVRDELAEALGPDQETRVENETANRPPPTVDASHPAITVRLQACILCTRCVRACRDVQVNEVIGVAGHGAGSRIVFDLDVPLGESTCVGCGECVQVCPTGALSPANAPEVESPVRTARSVCPYCGVGCRIRWHAAGRRIVRVDGDDGPANRKRLCVKGRFGFDYVHHPERLTRPLVRRPDAPRQIDVARLTPGEARALFRETSWEEALERAARGFLRIRERDGPRALAGFGSAKGTNEEAYLVQKLVRTGFGSNNVDHCTRLCHAASVTALLEMVGSGAVSNPVRDVAQADVILVIGANPSENHPVAATFMKNAVRNGATLIVMDPRRTPLARHARWFLPFRPDTDVLLLNGMLHAILEAGLVDERFVDRYTEGFEALRAHLEAFPPERVAPVCGIRADTIREVARAYASAERAMIFWGMGISQHIHGTDNARALIDLALITGQIGRTGTGLHPLRGQNNVQGASDVGLIPMSLPGYQSVEDARARARFEAAWRCRIDPEPGLTVVEVAEAARRGTLRGLYVLGENPAMSDPDLRATRQALAALEHLVVQDLFLTETALFADVVLPGSALPEKCGTVINTDRMVQRVDPVLDPPGDARQDWWIVQALAHRMGLDWNYPGPESVYEEIRGLWPALAGIPWSRLEQERSVTWPAADPRRPGREVLFGDGFPTPSGRARLRPARFHQDHELPDSEFPLVLITGRQLEHWHTGAMTRRARVLDRLQPAPVAFVHPRTLEALGMVPGELATVESRRGRLHVPLHPDPGLEPGQVFMPFCYREAAANLLTSAELDPEAKIPEFKFCAVRMCPRNAA